LFQALAAAESLDANLERCAPAAEKVFKKRFQTQRLFHGAMHFFDLAMSQVPPAGPYGCVISQACEEHFDFSEGKAHVTGKADQQHSVQSFVGVAALAAGTVRRREEAYLLVVADCRGIQAAALGKLANFHVSLLFPQKSAST
jgi:hypothetical protein